VNEHGLQKKKHADPGRLEGKFDVSVTRYRDLSTSEADLLKSHKIIAVFNASRSTTRRGD